MSFLEESLEPWQMAILTENGANGAIINGTLLLWFDHMSHTDHIGPVEDDIWKQVLDWLVTRKMNAQANKKNGDAP